MVKAAPADLEAPGLRRRHRRVGQLPLTARGTGGAVDAASATSARAALHRAKGGSTSTTAPAGSGCAASSRRTAVPSTSRLDAPSTRSSGGLPAYRPEQLADRAGLDRLLLATGRRSRAGPVPHRHHRPSCRVAARLLGRVTSGRILRVSGGPRAARTSPPDPPPRPADRVLGRRGRWGGREPVGAGPAAVPFAAIRLSASSPTFSSTCSSWSWYLPPVRLSICWPALSMASLACGAALSMTGRLSPPASSPCRTDPLPRPPSPAPHRLGGATLRSS